MGTNVNNTGNNGTKATFFRQSGSRMSQDERRKIISKMVQI